MAHAGRVIAILAGGGSLPATVAQAVGPGVCVLTFRDQPQPEPFPTGAMHACFALGQVTQILRQLHAWAVTDVVLAGHLHKPSLFTLLLDPAARRLVSRVRFKHDDALLRAVTDLLTQEGFCVRSAAEFCPDVLLTAGGQTKTSPTATDMLDIQLGRQVLDALGALDIGQAVVVKGQVVLGVEAIEGTDALIQRCASLRGGITGGVLVKAAKPEQLHTADLPTIGAQTLQLLAQHQFAGVAGVAGDVQLLERAQALALAERHGLFIYGIAPDA